MNKRSARPSILVVDDEERIRTILKTILSEEGYEVSTAKDGIDALEVSRTVHPSLLIVDLQMPRMDGIETIVRIKEIFPETIAIILTAHGTIQSAVQAIKQGAYDYLTKPFDNDQILLVVERAIEFFRVSQELRELRGQMGKDYSLESILGQSKLMRDLRGQIRQIAATDAAVLIEGESGTGKELASRAIHFESTRKLNPLVTVDCAAIPATLVESEFFGHESGAFTDARELRRGKFEEADSGTIFLDEVSELPLEAQTKLLRVLQEKEFARVGSAKPIRVDIRVIAATNRNLEDQVRGGKFREDLFYRLNVLKLRVPSLREHGEDIPLYAKHFLTKYRGVFRKSINNFSDDALKLLCSHEWKGNIRELENAIQRAMLSATGEWINSGDLGFLVQRQPAASSPYDPTSGLEAFIKSVAEQTEQRIILDALNETHWNRTEAAEKLKISRKTLFNKMQQYGMEEEGKSRE
jgi:DNA-binding NtrC family response regulator